jgi:DNA-binding transcriptional LysR family regulator
MNVNHLRAFVTVAEERSFRRAASRLHVSSSPLSRQIKALEQDLAATLFARDTRHVELSSAGARLLPLARDIVERLDALAHAAREPAEAAGRVLGIGTVHGLHPAVRDDVFRALACRRVAVTVAGAMTSALEAMVIEGELDLALLHLPLRSTTLAAAPLLREALSTVALCAGHPLAAQDAVEISQLTDVPALTYQQLPLSGFHRAFIDGLFACGIREVIYLTDNDVCAVANAIAGGDGFAVMASDPCNPLAVSIAADPRIVTRPLRGFNVPMVTAAAWRRERVAGDPLLRTAVSAIGMLAGAAAQPAYAA